MVKTIVTLVGAGFPPRTTLTIEEHDDIYVLVDDGPREQWRYVFVPHAP
jgi:hypothetical protein